MNISKADALALLGKWSSAQTSVRAVYKAVSGNVLVTGTINDLTTSAIKVVGNGSEILVFFRDTSEYEYTDSRQPMTEANREQADRYPAFIKIKFQSGDRIEISEFFAP